MTTLSARISRLRAASLETHPSLSTERAELLTKFYRQRRPILSAPVERALAFRFLLDHKEICINDGELIVGERGPSPKATPTYPELCCHSDEDLEILDSREKTSFTVSDEAQSVYRDTIRPFWTGRSMRELIFSEMSQGWKDSYGAGVFTEFMEQRAPGHTVLDDKIYRQGFRVTIGRIDDAIERLDFLSDPDALARREELKAMRIAAEALIHFAERHAEKARTLAEAQSDPKRRTELERIAMVCEHVPAEAPRDFYEAIQAYWFVHLGVITELNTWDSFCPGRLDQHLYPFYRQGLEEGALTRELAAELLQCLWIKFNNQPAPPKVGVTARESATYTDFALINTGGLTREGSDAVNDLTYLILDVIETMRLLQPSSCILVSKQNPDRFVRRAARIIRTGFGQPSIFNVDVIVQELVRQGKSLEDARQGGASGCVEVGAFGKEAYILSGYFNLTKVFEITLNNGIDPRTGKRLGPATGRAAEIESFDTLLAAFRKQLEHFTTIKIEGNNIIERLYARHMPTPFLSLLIDDCIEKGKDYHDGGARYNTTYVQGVGLGTLTDCLTAVKLHVFDEGTITLEGLLSAMKADFEGHESLRQRLVNKTPKYGNDDDYADEIMGRIFELFFGTVAGRLNTKGGQHQINLLPTTVHVYFGSVIGASPDGRRAWKPLSEGISPVQGADRCGPTAVLRSAAKLDHIRTGGTLLNQKLTPQLLEGEQGLNALVHLVRSYFRLDGHHIQFNVVDAATLRAAQTDPESHRGLIVRVAGYSDYFCDLGEALQDEIIDRTEHQAL